MFPEEVQLIPLRRVEFLEYRSHEGLEAHPLDDFLRIQTLEDPHEAHLFGLLIEVE